MGFSTDMFLSEPSDSFICVICHDVLKDAVSINCGHTFCGECIDNVNHASNNASCPNCRAVLRDFNPNYVVRDVIGKMSVRCPDGAECGWTGQIMDLCVHGNACMLSTIKCNVQGCNHTCQRKDMADHLSSTAGMLKHMELKYDRKLKEIEDKYEKKFADCKAEMELYKDRVKTLEEKVGTSGNDDDADMSSDDDGVLLPNARDPRDIMLVMAQTGCSRRDAIDALESHDWDLINAIMSLTHT